ncbi:hypothetical protein F2Q68_00001532 [Brassica cretica]|uniref:Peptidase C1A papain C-terminal domain-containing protein n=1 Tax=Brassica cretica TaxID=69181 RepID=A0A8S9JD69_BRACR|nr:hypothetical protein F2Q68_00001532 [Brassica cretica]
MDDDEEEEGPSLGARPRQSKQPNPLNQPRRDRQAHERGRGQAQQGRGGQAQQVGGRQADQGQAEQGRGGQAEQRGRGRGQAQLGHGRQSFGDGSSIQRDWTTSGLIGDPINQREDTCGSVVFTHLLQASYNKDKPIAQHRDLSYLVLANHIQSQTQAKGFSFRNLNIPINYIRNVGLRGHVGTEGRPQVTLSNDKMLQEHLFMTLWRPLGIVINNFPVFEDVGMGIYHVPLALDNVTPEHALLVLARGITDDGVEFVVAQNSWGTTTFGNQGYCRLFLPADGSFRIFWPHFD